MACGELSKTTEDRDSNEIGFVQSRRDVMRMSVAARAAGTLRGESSR